MTEIISDPAEMQRWVQQKEIGFVPTMGALHEGHLSLIKRAHSENRFVVVSIFVNPSQFGPNEDFAKYPRTFENDLEKCNEVGVDVVFHPEVADMAAETISIGNLGTIYEGASRPGHFSGVATVVKKLFDITEPRRAYFGKKDAQQCAVIRQLVHDFDIAVDLVFCEIVRDIDGVALSSRNAYLSAGEREAARHIPRSLETASQAFADGEQSTEKLNSIVINELSNNAIIDVDYVAIVDPERFVTLQEAVDNSQLIVAVRIGGTRLIDMCELGAKLNSKS